MSNEDRVRVGLRQDVAGVQLTYLEMALQWSAAAEAGDPACAGHAVRVAGYATRLAEHLGFDEETLFWFRIGALLHDIGKSVVPAEILSKPGALTPRERELVEQHPQAGAHMVANLAWPWDIRPMIQYHHERWDGGGYPYGLAGADIPIEARILSIADVFDALTSNRSYRPAYTPRQALAIMLADSGGAFDPVLLTTFRTLLAPAVAPRQAPRPVLHISDARRRASA